MGYSIEIENSRIIIKESSMPALFGIFERLMSDEVMSKYAYKQANSNTNEYWYSWVNTDNARRAASNKDIFGFFKEWGYDLERSNKADIPIGESHYWICHRDGSGKIGDEENLFCAVAPCVENGSFVEMLGEDGECWRWSWHDGKFYHQELVSRIYGKQSEVVVRPRNA